jgi:hypothetical protein
MALLRPAAPLAAPLAPIVPAPIPLVLTPPVIRGARTNTDYIYSAFLVAIALVGNLERAIGVLRAVRLALAAATGRLTGGPCGRIASLVG